MLLPSSSEFINDTLTTPKYIERLFYVLLFSNQEYNDSLRLALNAGKYFDISQKNEYIDTLLSKCIDEYTVLRRRSESDPTVVGMAQRIPQFTHFQPLEVMRLTKLQTLVFPQSM